jgi:glycosyltransferase involved in cell wall biosynthesis
MAAGIAASGYPEKDIAIVPNSSDLDFFKRDPDRGNTFRRQIGVAENEILVGYVGTLGFINDVGYLVRLAAALQADKRFKFIVVGEGQEREHVESLGRELGVLEKNFFMIRGMPKEEIPAVLSAVDIATSTVLPIPELEHNSANKFFDALAAGCCMAINHGGWQSEVLREADAGIQLSLDLARAASELQEIADVPGRIDELGTNGRRLAEERFSRDKLTAEIELVLAEAIAE